MTQFPRYAIYFVPRADSALHRFGAGLLGYDAFDGVELPFPADVVDAIADWQDLTADPRKYGFHATLKAPMALASDTTETDLLSALEDFANEPRDIPEIGPAVRALSGFTAIVPAHSTDSLNKLTDDCVRAFDGFRAPLRPEDRARRRPEKLTERQNAHLDRWGYPYVFEDFRFHMTLTGRLPSQRLAHIIPIIENQFSKLKLQSFAVDCIGLCRQIGPSSRFTIIGHWPLGPAVARS